MINTVGVWSKLLKALQIFLNFLRRFIFKKNIDTVFLFESHSEYLEQFFNFISFAMQNPSRFFHTIEWTSFEPSGIHKYRMIKENGLHRYFGTDQRVIFNACISFGLQILLVFVVCAIMILAYCSDINKSLTYQDVVESVCGKNAQRLCAFTIMTYCFGTCITFLIIIGDQWEECNYAFDLFYK